MRRVHGYSVATLVLIASVPLAFACGGGESKPPESPAGESSASSSSEAPAASDSAPADSASAAPAADTPAPSSESTAASTPPPPTLESTDCGKCIDKTCAKPAAACGKNTDCQAVIDAIHGCNGAAGSCIDGATPPTAKKPKALATAYGKCAKKAISKACKSQCQ